MRTRFLNRLQRSWLTLSAALGISMTVIFLLGGLLHLADVENPLRDAARRFAVPERIAGRQKLRCRGAGEPSHPGNDRIAVGSHQRSESGLDHLGPLRALARDEDGKTE